ncbi:endonuclease domain-containing protein [Enterobacter kobei]|uniref:endonuclease domain-containing protein n=1 Tax=Enterobacter kobei TaxID=208224 RepID=UPI0028D1DB2D|nr:endonuclease domain-containing protein [Enterobacter kobei]WNP35792.1 endonuclease domain-containing protein [Enterobacter kobei]
MKIHLLHARALRKNMTSQERKLWYLLRDRRFAGYKFRRQLPLGRFVVDFACWQAKLVIELDGGQHSENVDYDELRTLWLARHGWRVVRFWNNDLDNVEGVLMAITAALKQAPHPDPLPRERE